MANQSQQVKRSKLALKLAQLSGGPKAVSPAIGLWRAVAGELSKLAIVQQSVEKNLKVINEHRLGGILAVYEIEGPRACQDYFVQLEQEKNGEIDRNNNDMLAAASSNDNNSNSSNSNSNTNSSNNNNTIGKNKDDNDKVKLQKPINEEALLKMAHRDIDTLKEAYIENKAKLEREKKALESLINSFKKLVQDSDIAALANAIAKNGGIDAIKNSLRRMPSEGASDRLLVDDSTKAGGLGSSSTLDKYSSATSSGLMRKRRLDLAEDSKVPKRNKSGSFGHDVLGSKTLPSSASAAASLKDSSSSAFNNSISKSTSASPSSTISNAGTVSSSKSKYLFSATSTDDYLNVLFNGFPNEPLPIGAEVAFRLRKTRPTSEEEWIQCEVTKIYNDGARYEVRDPEPDENGNPGQTFKAIPRDLLPIPTSPQQINSLPPYPVGAQVLARYPETTTFYRAEVVGTKRDGKCRLKFEGEEEENKEQEVERRVVLPIRPQKSKSK